MMKLPRRALVCPPPDSYAHALTRDADPRPVDLAPAREQHAAYAAALRRIGLAVTELPPDPDPPDSCFAQDPAFVLGDLLVVARPRRAPPRALSAPAPRMHVSGEWAPARHRRVRRPPRTLGLRAPRRPRIRSARRARIGPRRRCHPAGRLPPPPHAAPAP